MGPLLAQLTKMGLENIGYELITDVVTFKGRNTDNGAVIREWIAQRPEFQLAELRQFFRERNRNPSSVDYTMKVLVEDGTLVALGDGHYRRSDPQLTGPEQQPQQPRIAKTRKSSHYAVGNRVLMWQTIGKRKRFNVSELNEVFKREGRPSSSMYSQLSKMVHEGVVKSLGDGDYEVIVRAKMPPNERTTKKPSKLNGHAHGEVTHGV